MIDQSHIGKTLPTRRATVDSARLRLFATAIGETDPIYLDEAAAIAAGYPALPAQPTFIFCLEREQDRPMAWLEAMGVDLGRILQGEQRCTYHAPIHAGDVLAFFSRIAAIYANRDGGLEFVVKDTRVTGSRDVLVAELRSVIVVRNA